MHIHTIVICTVIQVDLDGNKQYLRASFSFSLQCSHVYMLDIPTSVYPFAMIWAMIHLNSNAVLRILSFT